MQRIKHHPDDVSQKLLKLRNSLISATGKAIGEDNKI